MKVDRVEEKMNKPTERIIVVYTWIDDCNRVFVHTDKDSTYSYCIRYKNKEEAKSVAIRFCKEHLKKYPKGKIEYKVSSIISATEYWTPETIEKILSSGEMEGVGGKGLKRMNQSVFEDQPSNVVIACIDYDGILKFGDSKTIRYTCPLKRWRGANWIDKRSSDFEPLTVLIRN